jgi:deoxyribodipyrimidine photo-lyase
MSPSNTLFWFRRDLRLDDNAGLYHALRSGNSVLAIFIFDQDILEKLEDKNDLRVSFIYEEIIRLKKELNALGSDLLVRYGKPLEIFTELLKEKKIKHIYTNHDYEPYASQRDQMVKELVEENEGTFQSYKDQCIFEKEEVTKEDGLPYTVFTPYSKKWKTTLLSKPTKNNSSIPFYFQSYPTEKYFQHFQRIIHIEPIIGLNKMGFNLIKFNFPEKQTSSSIIKNYSANRNFPGINGTSHLGIHFRFGTISIREKARKAMELNETFLNELIWRDFYMQILFHFPKVVDNAFKIKYDRIVWRNDENEFEKFCLGQTGYPIVDAGMRELNTTGFMHNRVRMIVASFLCKHLLIDWRWGEAYFAKKLLDFDLSANNGGWQWAAGCGTDAAPYFRVFNPTLQTEKFDKQFTYIKNWVPEFGSNTYVKPIVNHEFARNRCLEVYKSALNP